MFKALKKIFTKKNKVKSTDIFNKDLQVVFQDRKLQQISLTIQPSSNDTVMMIKEKKSNVEIALDRELSLVIASILQEYATTNTIQNTIKMISEDK